jgi:putative peptidoglycan lipid II flippase
MSRRALGGIAGAAGLIAALTLLARIAGFGRTAVFAAAVRASGVGDVYSVVNTVPNVVHEVAAGGALAATTVPLIAGHFAHGRRGEAHRAASTLLTWALAVLLPLGVVVWLFAEPITAALVSDRIDGGREVGATMLRIFAAQVPLYGLAVVLAGLLHAQRRFAAVALAPLLSSLVVMATYAAYGWTVQGRTVDVPESAVNLLAWGTTAGVAALALPLLVPAYRSGWRYRPSLRFVGEDGLRARRLAGAGLLALAAQQLAMLAIVRLASTYGQGQGSASVFTWIFAVVMLPYAVLVIPLATAAFPALATKVATDPGDAELSGATVRLLARSLHVAAILGVVGAVALVVLSPIVGALFTFLDSILGGGVVSGDAVPAMAAGLRAFAPGLVGFGIQAILTRALYIRGRPVAAGLAVALGWAIAVLVPALTLDEESGAALTVILIGVGWSIGMTIAALVLVVLTVRHWGTAVLRGWGDTLRYLRSRLGR